MTQKQIVSDPAVLRSEGRNFEYVGQEYLKALDVLSKGLAALEKGDTPPWGDDDLGEKFGVVYEGLRDGMEQSMEYLGTRLGEIGRALETMGSNHAANDTFTSALVAEQEADAAAKRAQLAKLKAPSA